MSAVSGFYIYVDNKSKSMHAYDLDEYRDNEMKLAKHVSSRFIRIVLYLS